MEKPHYYYKTPLNSEVGKKLQDFFTCCKKAEEKARQWAEKVGASSYYESPEGMAGRVCAVEFADTHERDGWDKDVSLDGRALFFPIEGTDLEKEMLDLPVVSETELISIMNLVPKRTDKNLPMPMSFGDSTPIVFLHHDYWYADVPYVSGDLSVETIDEKEFYRRKMAATNEQAYRVAHIDSEK